LERIMKKLFVLVFVLGVAGAAVADIQDPPSNDYGPTRKLGRGVSNFLFAPAELFVTVATINTQEGNSTAAGYGVIRGTGRTVQRNFAGLIEILSFPFPSWHDSYYPLLPSNIPWIHAGYAEFPPELGNESKYPYVRDY
jgi:putative exosortase-associated protein (TIGR04073 family)